MDVDLGEMVTDSRLIGMQISARGSKALSKQGLTAIQARVLLYILEHSKRGTSLTEIHRETGYSMAATSGLIKRLREKDYVRVEACKLDERRKLLFATEKGERVRESIDAVHEEPAQPALQRFYRRGAGNARTGCRRRCSKTFQLTTDWILEG